MAREFSPSPENRKPAPPLEKKAKDFASLDDKELEYQSTRKRSTGEVAEEFKAVDKKKIEKPAEERTVDSDPVVFSHETEIVERGDYRDSDTVLNRITETGRAIVRTANGVLERVRGIKSRVSSPDSAAKQWREAARNAGAAVGGALRFGAERLGLVKSEQEKLADRVREAEEQYQKDLEALYQRGEAAGAIDYLDAYEKLNAVETELEGAK